MADVPDAFNIGRVHYRERERERQSMEGMRKHSRELESQTQKMLKECLWTTMVCSMQVQQKGLCQWV
jgi:hypothetical protein